MATVDGRPPRAARPATVGPETPTGLACQAALTVETEGLAGLAKALDAVVAVAETKASATGLVPFAMGAGRPACPTVAVVGVRPVEAVAHATTRPGLAKATVAPAVTEAVETRPRRPSRPPILVAHRRAPVVPPGRDDETAPFVGHSPSAPGLHGPPVPAMAVGHAKETKVARPKTDGLPTAALAASHTGVAVVDAAVVAVVAAVDGGPVLRAQAATPPVDEADAAPLGQVVDDARPDVVATLPTVPRLATPAIEVVRATHVVTLVLHVVLVDATGPVLARAPNAPVTLYCSRVRRNVFRGDYLRVSSATSLLL